MKEFLIDNWNWAYRTQSVLQTRRGEGRRADSTPLAQHEEPPPLLTRPHQQPVHRPVLILLVPDLPRAVRGQLDDEPFPHGVCL